MADRQFQAKIEVLLEDIVTRAADLDSIGNAHKMAADFSGFARDSLSWLRLKGPPGVIDAGTRRKIMARIRAAQQVVVEVHLNPEIHHARNFASLDSAAHHIRNGIDLLYRLPGQKRPSIPGWPRKS